MTRAARSSLASVILGSALFFLSFPISDNDLWGHVLFGGQILESLSLPRTNGYSYTAPDHPWINHEILAECALAAAYGSLGGFGLNLLRLAMAIATLLAIAHTCMRRTRDATAIGITLVIASSLMAYGFLLRPQLFTFVFLAVLWDRIQAVGFGAHPGVLWIAPPLVALWTNSHGGVLAGLGVLVVFAAIRSLDREHRHARATLAFIVIASVAAFAVNPYGLSLPAFLLHDVTIDRPISEWGSIPLLTASNLLFKLAVLAWIAIAALQRRAPRWEVAILVVATIAVFRHERHLPLFAILAAPLLASGISSALQRVRQRPAARSFSEAVVGVCGVAMLGLSLPMHATLSGGIFVSPNEFPIGAVRFLQATSLSGNLAVPFGWGEYALWHLYPRFRVNVDGRYTTAYPQSVLDEAWRYMDGGDGWGAHVREATAALVDRRHATEARLLGSPDWKRVYADPIASIFVRSGATMPARPGPHVSAGVTVFP